MADAMYMNFAEIIKQVSQDKRLVPDLMKAENGNNFRAISESAILDVISPVLEENHFYYTVEVKDSHLDIREAFGSKGKKLQFIATITVKLRFWHHWEDDYSPNEVCHSEAVGMGIDDNDKAMGKAYTYAVKYALLKLFRLRYGDDPDFEASKPLHVEKPKEEKESKKITPKEDEPVKKIQKPSKKSTSGMDKPMTEAQRDYILGMMKQHNVSEKEILEKFGVEPSRDEFIPMPTARAVIKWLEEGGYLPF